MVDISWMVSVSSVIAMVVVWVNVFRKQDHGFWAKFFVWTTLVLAILAMVLGQKLDHIWTAITMVLCLVMLYIIEKVLIPKKRRLDDEKLRLELDNIVREEDRNAGA